MHGSGSYRVPWNHGEDAVKVTAKMVNAKLRLMPYLYGQVRLKYPSMSPAHVLQAIQAHETGLPVLRPMTLDFPTDPACAFLDQTTHARRLPPRCYRLPRISRIVLYPRRSMDVFLDGRGDRGAEICSKRELPAGYDSGLRETWDGVVAWAGRCGRAGLRVTYGSVGLGLRKYELNGDVELKVPCGKGKAWAGTVKVSSNGKMESGGAKIINQ